jgi:hypothetical protein
MRGTTLPVAALLAAQRQITASGSSITSPSSIAVDRAPEDDVTMSNQPSQINSPASVPAEVWTHRALRHRPIPVIRNDNASSPSKPAQARSQWWAVVRWGSVTASQATQGIRTAAAKKEAIASARLTRDRLGDGDNLRFLTEESNDGIPGIIPRSVGGNSDRRRRRVEPSRSDRYPRAGQAGR